MKKHGLTSAAALKGPSTPEQTTALRDTVHDIASQAYAHLSKAQELTRKGDLPRNAHFALLPAVESSLLLEQMQRDDFTPALYGSDHFHFVKLQLQMLKFVWTKKL
jgi:hypothetical protein